MSEPIFQAGAMAAGSTPADPANLIADGGATYTAPASLSGQTLYPGTSVLAVRVGREQVVTFPGGHYSPYGADAAT